MTPLPLAGVRVLDLTRLLPGGYCSLLFADFGADVVKVEDTGMGDYIRWSPPFVDGPEESAKGSLFLALNRNKRSIRIDLKSERGKEVLLRLVKDADVLLEGFRPGVLDRLGVGYDVLLEANPGLVICPISGYGQDGPYRDRSGHDMNYLSVIGVLGMQGEDPERTPVQGAGQMADLGGGGLMAAFGVLAALHHRDRTGEGQVVDVSMADGALSWMAMVAPRVLMGDAPPARGRDILTGGVACYRPYRCADGWVTFGALEPKFFQAWARGIDREDLIDHQFSAPGSEGHKLIEAVFLERTRDEWAAFAGEVDCCLEPVLDLAEALDSELVRAREMVVGIEQPGAATPVEVLGIPVKMSATPGDPHRLPGPGLGEHTDEVLREAGFSDAEIDELAAAGAVARTAQEKRGSFLG